MEDFFYIKCGISLFYFMWCLYIKIYIKNFGKSQYSGKLYENYEYGNVQFSYFE